MGLVVSPVSEYVHAPGKFIAPIPPHSLRVERDVSLEMCAAKCTIYFRTRQFPCYAFEYTAGSRMCVYTNMTTLLIQDGYLGLHDNPSVDFYERSKGLHGSVSRITYNCLHFYIFACVMFFNNLFLPLLCIYLILRKIHWVYYVKLRYIHIPRMYFICFLMYT